MMIKLSLKGEPAELASFIEHLESMDAINVLWNSDVSKRAEHHKWGSVRAGIEAEIIPDVSPDISIYSGNKKKGEAQSGYVYLLPAWGKTGVIGYKIGKTTNPHSRRKTFSVKFNFDVEFIALISTDDISAQETSLHRLYADKRRGASEFFNLTDEDVQHIQSLMSDEDKAFLEGFNDG